MLSISADLVPSEEKIISIADSGSGLYLLTGTYPPHRLGSYLIRCY